MFVIPTMDDWHKLALKYPEYKTVTNTVLKDYGVMQCIEFIRSQVHKEPSRKLRILEFGHGFNPAVMMAFQNDHEVWGADRDQQLHYFKGTNWEERFRGSVEKHCPNVRFVRELLGDEPSLLPNNYFDIVLSISVLEEVPLDVARAIVSVAYSKLAPGGYLIGTHDLCFANIARAKSYADIQTSVGFDVEFDESQLDVKWTHVLLEHPAVVMRWYQQAEPDDESRRYGGHYGTIYTVAKKIGR